MKRFIFSVNIVGMLLGSGLLVGCAGQGPLPPNPPDGEVPTCLTPEPALQVREGESSVRNAAIYRAANNGFSALMGQACFVSDRVPPAQRQRLHISATVGLFTTRGELFAIDGQGGSTAPQNNPPATPRWQVGFRSHDPIDGQYLARLSDRTVVTVEDHFCADDRADCTPRVTHAWLRRAALPGQRVSTSAVAPAARPHVGSSAAIHGSTCLNPGVMHPRVPQVRDLHLLIGDAGNALTASACVSARAGLFLASYNVLIVPLRSDGSDLMPAMGNGGMHRHPLRDAAGAGVGTVALTRDSRSVDPMVIAGLTNRARVTLTYEICRDASFSHCDGQQVSSKEMLVTIDRVTVDQPAPAR